MRRWWRSVT